jgi:hypothetical protein
MMKKRSPLILSLLLSSGFATAGPVMYSEDFNADLPAWESNWLGLNSNLSNYFINDTSYRGMPLDGLWISDGDNTGNADIVFDAGFGSGISHFSIDLATWTEGYWFVAFDMADHLIFSSLITAFDDAFFNPASYQTLSFSSSNGLKGFSIVGDYVEGDVAIDNVLATIGGSTSKVPESSSLMLLILGLLGLVFGRTRHQQ